MMKRLIASITLTGFIFSLFQAYPLEAAPASRVTAIAIPKEIGSVESFGQSSAKGTILILEDAHGVSSAQESITGILKYLENAYPVTLVASEGSSRDFDTFLYKTYPNIPRRDNLLQKLLEAGKISGVDLAAIQSGIQTRYTGIEDENLYRKNLKAYFDVQALNQTLKTDFEKLKDQNRLSEEKYFPKELLLLIHSEEKFREEKEIYSFIQSLSNFQSRILPQENLKNLFVVINNQNESHFQESISKLEFQIHSLSLMVPEKKQLGQWRQEFQTRGLSSVFYFERLFSLLKSKHQDVRLYESLASQIPQLNSGLFRDLENYSN